MSSCKEELKKKKHHQYSLTSILLYCKQMKPTQYSLMPTTAVHASHARRSEEIVSFALIVLCLPRKKKKWGHRSLNRSPYMPYLPPISHANRGTLKESIEIKRTTATVDKKKKKEWKKHTSLVDKQHPPARDFDQNKFSTLSHWFTPGAAQTTKNKMKELLGGWVKTPPSAYVYIDTTIPRKKLDNTASQQHQCYGSP